MRIKRIIAALCITLILIGKAWAGFDAINPTFCRVEDSKFPRGSAVVIGENKESYFILTAGHVVADDKTLYLRFYHDRIPSEKIPAKVIKKVYQVDTINDLAELELKKADYHYLPPRSIKLAPATLDLSNSIFYNVGIPDGHDGWPIFYKGYFLKEKVTGSGADGLAIYPPPARGRSGSGICVETSQGTELVGIVILTSGKDGIAVPVWRIEDFLNEKPNLY